MPSLERLYSVLGYKTRVNKARGEDTLDPNSMGIDVDLHRSLSLELKFRRTEQKREGQRHSGFSCHSGHYAGWCLTLCPTAICKARLRSGFCALRISETPIKGNCKFKAYKGILLYNPREVPICLLSVVQLLRIISKGRVLCSACLCGHSKPVGG